MPNTAPTTPAVASPPRPSSPSTLSFEACPPDPPSFEGVFETSPGGAAEVSAEWVAEHHCKVKLVDVREPGEVTLGRIPGIEVVPLGEVAERAAAWDPSEPIVFVCRSGRRSTRAVEQVETLGFTRTASMTGGMKAWRAYGLPEEQGGMFAASGAIAPETGATPSGPLDETGIASLIRQEHVPRVRAASLLLQGSEACVDGREPGAVIGVPGGDAGELLLALATFEELTGETLDQAAVRQRFHTHVAHFGRFYMHTDDHALEHLAAELRRDPRFAEVDTSDVEPLLRRPPVALRRPLIEHLTTPANIGCGHLKLVASHPEEYGVRRELLNELLTVVFERLWQQPEDVRFVVLHGEHAEEAVLSVEASHQLHAYDNIPALSPRLGGRSFFIHHPQAAEFVRRQEVGFIMERDQRLSAALTKAGVSANDFERAVGARANQQLTATLRHLAATLPLYHVKLGDDGSVAVSPLSTTE